MAGKGGGAWKVAYADFVTAMMAFFMVMWLVSQKVEIKEAVAEHFQDPFGKFSSGERLVPPLFKQHAKTRVDSDETGGFRKQKKILLAKAQGDATNIGTTIRFAEDSAELDDAARKQLRDFASDVVGKPQKIEIRGHTTRRPMPPGGPFQSPWQLAYARCVKTMEFLEELGIPPDRVRLSQAGPFEPEEVGFDPKGLGRNARVEISLLRELVQARKPEDDPVAAHAQGSGH